MPLSSFSWSFFKGPRDGIPLNREALKALSFEASFLPLVLVLVQQKPGSFSFSFRYFNFQKQRYSETVMDFFRSFVFCIVLFFRVFSRALTADDGTNTLPRSHDFHSASPPPPTPPKSNLAPFRPSIAVIVGVLTTMFSITFLLLLYAKHCKRNSEGGYSGNPNSAFAPSNARRNSGIDRAVIESLPIFKFSSLRGPKDGLECAVCLNRFELAEVLRLLPKCKHAFHVECVDTWLDAHSTCPLCRYRVDPEDVLLVEDLKPFTKIDNAATENSPEPGGNCAHSGRHSSAGEKFSNFMQVVDRDAEHETSSRQSVDGSCRGRKKEIPARVVETVTAGCFDRGRKDLLLLEEASVSNRESFERRLSHRIIVSDVSFPRRWSDLKPSDLLFLRSEMIITNSGRYSFSASNSNPRAVSDHTHEHRLQISDEINGDCSSSFRSATVQGISNNDKPNAINSRSVSEITGLSRFGNRTSVRSEEEKFQKWLGQATKRTSQWLVSTEKNSNHGH